MRNSLLIIGYFLVIFIIYYPSAFLRRFTKAHCPYSLALLLSACASPPSVQVLDLPPRPVAVAPKEALQPIPPADYFLTQWRKIFKP
ncbi:hypothetical protein CNX70_21810 [Janthinobacterium svalbardensis]|uniref:Lipoprotein n=1 Tax=Janthinobacterium svalbardensis TaxID=368607 RepID=A0A290X0T9_9BURK|nr:hypothetical protein CNX70_21810 [Janthinobacterium svalbardensis]